MTADAEGSGRRKPERGTQAHMAPIGKLPEVTYLGFAANDVPAATARNLLAANGAAEEES